MRYLLATTIVFLITTTFAQRQNQIVEPWKMWANLHIYCHSTGTEYSTDFIRFNGDTVVDGISYKKVEYAEDEAHENWNFYGYFIREENKKVFLKRPFEPEGLIYDFTLQNIGDTVTINNPVTNSALFLTLTAIDSVETTGGWRQRKKFSAEGYEPEEYWIDGIGSGSGVLNSGMAVFGGLCGAAELLCEHEYDTLVYQNPQYGSCYIVTTGMEEINGNSVVSVYFNNGNNELVLKFKNSGKKEIVVYDINGRTLKSFTTLENYAAIYLTPEINGLIFISISGNNKRITKKLLMNR